MNTATPSEQRAHYQSVIDDLKSRLRQREEAIQVQLNLYFIHHISHL